MVRREPQLPLFLERPVRRRGGLDLDGYEALVTRLRADAQRVAERFRLPAYDLDADKATAHDRYGICYEDGTIRVRLVHATTGRPLKYSALVDTVVHELAHLRYLDHGERWERLYERMLAWARTEGIYVPRDPSSKEAPALSCVLPSSIANEPEQIALFGRKVIEEPESRPFTPPPFVPPPLPRWARKG